MKLAVQANAKTEKPARKVNVFLLVPIPAQARVIKPLSPADTLVQRPAFADKPVTKTVSVLQPVKTKLLPSRLTRLTQQNPAQLAVQLKPLTPAGLVTTAMKNQAIPALNNVPIPAQAKVIKLPNPAVRLVRQRLSADRLVIMTVSPTALITFLKDIAEAFVGMWVLSPVPGTAQPITSPAATINVQADKAASAEIVCLMIPAITKRRSAYLPTPAAQATTATAQTNARPGLATPDMKNQEPVVLRRPVPIPVFILYVLVPPTAIVNHVR